MKNTFIIALCCLTFSSTLLCMVTLQHTESSECDEQPQQQLRLIQRSYAHLRIPSTVKMLEKQNSTLQMLLNQAKNLNNETWINKLQEHLEMNTILSQHFRTVDGRAVLNMDAYQRDLEQKGFLIADDELE